MHADKLVVFIGGGNNSFQVALSTTYVIEILFPITNWIIYFPSINNTIMSENVYRVFIGYNTCMGMCFSKMYGIKLSANTITFVLIIYCQYYISCILYKS